jgi:hypothetical protein
MLEILTWLYPAESNLQYAGIRYRCVRLQSNRNKQDLMGPLNAAIRLRYKTTNQTRPTQYSMLTNLVIMCSMIKGGQKSPTV